MKKKKILDSVVLVFLITMLAKIMGLAKDMVFAYYWGTSNLTDAYTMAFFIPNNVISIISTGITTCFLPIYIESRNKEGINSANKYASNVINTIVLFCIVASSIFFVFTEPVLRILAPGFDKTTMEVTASLTRISIFQIFAIGVISVFTCMLQANRKYFLVTVGSTLVPILTCIGTIIGGRNSIKWVTLFGTIGYFTEALMLLYVLIKDGYGYTSYISFKDGNIKETYRLMIPTIIGSSASEISKMADRIIGSLMAAGSVTMLTYANRIDDTLITLFSTSVVSLAYPAITAAVNDRNTNTKKIEKSINDYAILLMMLAIPISLVAIVYSQDIIGLLYKRGNFDSDSAAVTSKIFRAYAAGIIFFTIRKFVNRVFYAFHDTKTPTVNSMLSIAINIVLSVILGHIMGVTGIAWGTTISAIIAAIMLIYSCRKHIPNYNYKILLVALGKLCLAAGTCTFISRAVYSIIESRINYYLLCGVTAVIGVSVYVAMLIVLDMKHYLIMLKARH